MAQPPGTPPGEWEPRTDGAARKLIERADRLADEIRDVSLQVARLEGKVEQAVTWPKLIVILGSTAATVLGAAWFVVNSGAASGEARVAKAQAQFNEGMQGLRSEMASRSERQDAKQEALLRVLVDGKPRQQAKRELEKKGLPRIDSN